MVRLRMGAIDQAVRTRPHAHFHVASKASWWEITDGLEQREAE